MASIIIIVAIWMVSFLLDLAFVICQLRVYNFLSRTFMFSEKNNDFLNWFVVMCFFFKGKISYIYIFDF